MENEFPYEACRECQYRFTKEDLENYGPRGVATIGEETACGKKTCKLESTLVVSSAKLNVGEEK